MEESDNAKKELVSARSSHEDAVDFINAKLSSHVTMKDDQSARKSSPEILDLTITKIPSSLNGSMHFFSEKNANPKSIIRRKKLVNRQMNILRKQKKKE